MLAALSPFYEGGFSSAALHDLIADGQLNTFSYFIGYVVTLQAGKLGEDGSMAMPTVLDIQRMQEHVLIPYDHQHLRSTLCDLAVDMPDTKDFRII